MKLYTVLLPVIGIVMLQAGGCSSGNDVAAIGGTYISTSAGAFFDQSGEITNQEDITVANISFLGGSHRPLFDPDKVYVAAGASGVLISENGGKSWELHSAPLSQTTDIIALETGVLVIAGRNAEGQGFIMRSSDRGKSWEQVLTVPVPIGQGGILSQDPAGTQAVVIALAPDPFHGDRLYAGTNLGGLLVGEQSAKTWRTKRTLLASRGNRRVAVRKLVPSPHREEEVMVISDKAQLVKVVDDEDLEALNIPKNLESDSIFNFDTRAVRSVSYVSDNPDALIVGTANGAVITRNQGGDWEGLPVPADVSKQFNSSVVTVSPTNSARMFVGLNAVIYRSEDAGRTWNTFNMGLKNHVITDILINPNNASQVLTITRPLGG